MLDITYIVEKNCFLNQIKDNNMSLEELRFLCIYLSRINARDVSTRCIRFTLSDFQKIMNIGRMNINFYKAVVNDLLGHVVHMPNDNGGLDSFQLFKKAKLFIDDNNECCVEIDVHDDALPLFFNLKGNYVTYELWNALRLKSANQLLMYELLKQYEKLGKLEIKVSELREYLSFIPGQYPQFERFKTRVLDSCQKALAENTDIRFTYEHGKRGLRGKWLTIIFHIYKNTDYKAPLELRDFIDKKSASQPPDKLQGQSNCPPDEQPQPPEPYDLISNQPTPQLNDNPQLKKRYPDSHYSNDLFSFLASACDFEFSDSQMHEIYDIILSIPNILSDYKYAGAVDDFKYAYFHYIREVYSRFKVYTDKNEVFNRYACFRQFFINDRKKSLAEFD